MTAEQQKLEKELADLEAFMDSPAYAGWLSARDTEIGIVEQRILMTPPVNEKAISDLLLWFGELDTIRQMKETFKDARVTLKATIDKLVEVENENASDTKI